MLFRSFNNVFFVKLKAARNQFSIIFVCCTPVNNDNVYGFFIKAEKTVSCYSFKLVSFCRVFNYGLWDAYSQPALLLLVLRTINDKCFVSAYGLIGNNCFKVNVC